MAQKWNNVPGNLTERYETLIVRLILFLKLLGVFYRYLVYSMCNTYKSFQSLTNKFLSCNSGKERGTFVYKATDSHHDSPSPDRVRTSLDKNLDWQTFYRGILGDSRRFSCKKRILATFRNARLPSAWNSSTPTGLIYDNRHWKL